MRIIKARKQGHSITVSIPASFKIPAGTHFLPKLTPKGIFYEFVKDDKACDFDTDILRDLINQGYEGTKLLKQFQKMKKSIPEAMNKLRKEAEREPAMSKKEAEIEFEV
ncbi:toxin-antitoxin system [Lactobacillus helveticus]|uniref:toxin-antitoxin system n=2 Tax=Lactobacillus helveticus TaxID=1587 RepID=UPI001561F1C5|nr:toxin-antitoxin system [Lactobacillus helveticus]NRN89815.1 hypothetical protein [Lactobacillus helveticus]NRN93264.1 hypothetical protein [Lactobacillus helveticus]NRO26971.1 hypothetical protein [Lactobacillus helveticus]NRO31534.1 hypothetical protein [Lactobacillus helveticus]NRO37389.1 hypothetical protein [Lactobacillus helveticus]